MAADERVYNYIEELNSLEPLPEIILNKLELEYKRYLICGGMPEAVTALLENKGMQVVEETLQNILDLYTLDFSKYASSVEIPRINSLWTSLPSQLAKENRKFIYKIVKSGARAREYEDALLWLVVPVKSETRISGKSLSVYAKKFDPKLRIRFSMNNLKENNGLLSLPLPLVDWTYKLVRFIEG